MSATTEILDEIEQFLETSGMTATSFGRDALGDSAFVFELRQGRDLRLSTAARVRKFIADWQRANGPLALSAA